MTYTRQQRNALRKEEAIRAGLAKGRAKEQIAADIRVCIDTLKTYCKHLGIVLPDYAPRGPRAPRAEFAATSFEFRAPVKRKSKKRRSWWRRFLELFS